ncbi:LysR family transcriptional regulator [Dryocola sp. BD626]|uniref:LysR family transcriptional regulator n=1 Tax=Dryocola sp. BD626 TaxID=3133273 RepID=UPI003F4FD62F
MRELRNLDLNLLKTLDALLEERSVTRAATRLSVTQPAVSGMLTRLRDSFNDPLFIRTQRGIVPTDRALQLAGPVKRILDDVEQILRPAEFDPATSDLTVSLTATDYALQAIVLPFIGELRRIAPGMRVAVRPPEDSNAQQQLEKGEMDIAIMTTYAVAPDLHARTLYEEKYVCAMGGHHPLAGQPAITLDEFCAWDHALVSWSGSEFNGVTDIALQKLGYRRRVSLSVQSFLFLKEVLRTTALIAVVPARLITPGQDIVTLTPPLAIPGFTKVAAWHERTHQDAAHRWVREVLFESCGEIK